MIDQNVGQLSSKLREVVATMAQDRKALDPSARSQASRTSYLCELDFAAGLDSIVRDELLRGFGDRIQFRHPIRPRRGLVGFD